MGDPVCRGAGAETADLLASQAVRLKALPDEAQLLQAGRCDGVTVDAPLARPPSATLLAV